jgi:hypothetical protein
VTTTERLVGVKGVAAWCGVSQAAVSQWIIRFPGRYPKEDATIGELDTDYDIQQFGDGEPAPEREHPDRGWKPGRRDEWVEFARLSGYRRFLPDDTEQEEHEHETGHSDQ